jgi:hypothetical protein
LRLPYLSKKFNARLSDMGFPSTKNLDARRFLRISYLHVHKHQQ